MTVAPHGEALQRRVLGTLIGTQALGGVGVASGIAVMALLARNLSGSDQLAGLGTTFQVLGSALIAVPVARLMAARGRRPGLALGYLLALAGSVLVILAAVQGWFWLMLVGSLLFGGGTTSGNQARFAGADLAPPDKRGRHLSVVVWATTIGSVAGPNLVGPAERLGERLSMPALTGSFLFAIVGFACAALVVTVGLRPDPLLVARARALADAQAVVSTDPVASTDGQSVAPPTQPVAAPGSVKQHGSVRAGWRAIRVRPTAMLGLVTMALGHAVMVGVMVMTPLHMDHGGAGLTLIGLVISVHVLGMFAFSPITGWAVDRLGGRSVALIGAAVLLSSGVLAALTPEGMSARLVVALFGIGLGWSGTLVSGSALLVGALPVDERPAAQGVADLVMGICGASAGALAGIVLQHAGYPVLALGACLLAVGIIVAALLTGQDRPTHRATRGRHRQEQP